MINENVKSFFLFALVYICIKIQDESQLPSRNLKKLSQEKEGKWHWSHVRNIWNCKFYIFPSATSVHVHWNINLHNFFKKQAVLEPLRISFSSQQPLYFLQGLLYFFLCYQVKFNLIHIRVASILSDTNIETLVITFLILY